MPNNNFNIKSKKDIPTSSVLQNIESPNTSQFISKPEIPNQEEQDNSRFLASLLGQGVAMFGAGIAGRDPMRAGEIISDQRAYQERLNQQQKIQKEQKDLADNLMNPESKQSLRKRLLYSRALGVDIPNDISASDLEDPVVLNSLKQQSIQAQMAKMPKQLGVVQPKVDKDEQKNIQSFKDATAESNKFIKQLEEYSDLVKKIPVTGGTFAKGASTVESAKVLRGKLLLQLKNIEKTGALDAGMIAIADQILGTPDYTREEVINAKTNQLKSAIKDDIHTNAIKFGIVGTVQGEDGNYYYVDKNNNPIMKVQ